MRRLTITERVIAAVALPVLSLLAVPHVVTAWAPVLGEANTAYAELVFGFAVAALSLAVALGTAYGIARPLTEAADTIDAIAHAQLESAQPLRPGRSEITRLIAVTDRLADVL